MLLMTELIEQMLPEQMRGTSIHWKTWADGGGPDRACFYDSINFYTPYEVVIVYVYHDEVAVRNICYNDFTRVSHPYDLANPDFDVEAFIKFIVGPIRELENAVDD